MKLYEDKIKHRLCLFLKGPNKILLSEFPFLSRIVDVVVYDENLDELSAIEIKMKNFRELIDQINFCRYFADKVFIAIPQEKFQTTNKYKILPEDIGLITFRRKNRSIVFKFEKYPKHSFLKDRKLACQSRILLEKFKKVKLKNNV